MTRIGLTGGLGSGKTTVAGIFAELGAHILSSDEIARGLMQPGQPVFAAIVKKFGPNVVREDGTLNRAELSRLAFAGGRVEELNAIVHPAAIARQEDLVHDIAARDPNAIIVVESALIFETKHSRGWRGRFDKMILVRATDEHKIARYVTRMSAQGADPAVVEADARLRLSKMLADDKKAAQCDFVILNDGTLDRLRQQVTKVWSKLSPKPPTPATGSTVILAKPESP